MEHVAFLRAINVGGRSVVSMSAIKGLFVELGFPDARTVLQTGNVIFKSDKRSAASLESLFERETQTRLGVRTNFFIRDAKELSDIVKRNPFVREAESDPSHLVVLFLKNAPRAEHAEMLQSWSKGPEIIRVTGRQLYAFYPAGIGRSKLTVAVMERALGTQGTGRNWNTVLKLLPETAR